MPMSSGVKEQALAQKLTGSLELLSIKASSPPAPASTAASSSVDGSMSQMTDMSSKVSIYYVSNAGRKRRHIIPEDEPLVDTTAALTKNSKKTARSQKRQQMKAARKVHSDIQSLLDFPQELLLMIVGFLRPSDIFTLLRLSKSTRAFILDNERALAHDIVSRRYWVLKQCFLLPVPFDQVPPEAQPVLTSEQWQDRLRIHKNPYQHIKPIDPSTTCSCMSCVLAWNYLNITLDLAHWQQNLETREPLPIIPRGRNPDWNVELLERHAAIVRKAMKSPLVHARILQKHLKTTTGTIIRSGRWRKKGEKTTTPKPRTYHLTDVDAVAGTDEYLERSGPPSYQHPYMRDNYYNLEAFVPNRKWKKDEQQWVYYTKWPQPHLNDLNWLVARFTPKSQSGHPDHQQPPGLSSASDNAGSVLRKGTTMQQIEQIGRLIETTASPCQPTGEYEGFPLGHDLPPRSSKNRTEHGS